MLLRFDPSALGRSLSPVRRNLAYVAIWTVVFSAMSAAKGVGDNHPGQWLPFWQQACEEGRRGACDVLVEKLSAYCDEASGWACNEAAVLRVRLSRSNEDGEKAATADAVASLERGCAFGFKPACQNVLTMVRDTGQPDSAPPTLDDYPIILRGSKQSVPDRRPTALYALACQQGWPAACGRSTQAGED